MNPSVRVVCRGCLRSVEKKSGAEGSDPARCPYCGDVLDSRPSSVQSDEENRPDWVEAERDVEAEGTSQSPTEIREKIDWVKTWVQGSLGSLGRFQLRERMGDGGFGTVFRAYDPRLDRDVAVKVLKQPNPSERTMERFFREARAVARLDHPNIVAVYDAGFDDGRSWVAYQLVSGRPLWWYREHHPMDAATAARIVRALADALDHSHYLGVVHRDLKPSNVIIDDRGQPRLIDFGLARRSDLESDLTRDGAILGTPAYMSPEQALGHSRQVDERADVYSLGVIFYELLTGHHPDEPSTTSSDPPPPQKPRMAIPRRAQRMPSLSPTVPRALRQICKKAMAADPAARYPTARAIADAIDSWLQREDRHADRIRLAFGGVAMGVSLAVVLLFAIQFLLTSGLNPRASSFERGASLPISTTEDPQARKAVATPGSSRKSLRESGENARPPAQSEVQLIGNSETGTYHTARCRHVPDVANPRRVVLASAEAAAEQRYRPCKVCNPPVANIAPIQTNSSSRTRAGR